MKAAVAETIVKHAADHDAANVPDLERARAAFTWEAARETLQGLPGGASVAHRAGCTVVTVK